MKINGIITAGITPMTSDGNALADPGTFEKYYQFLLDRRINGLFVCGTTGEGMLMPLSDRKAVAERAVSIVAKQVPVLVHVGCNSTAESVELTKHARSIHADGVGVITPYFFSYDKLAMFRHFQAVANAASDLPVFLYYLPSMAHNDIPPQLISEIRSVCPNVIGLKRLILTRFAFRNIATLAGKDLHCLVEIIRSHSQHWRWEQMDA